MPCPQTGLDRGPRGSGSDETVQVKSEHHLQFLQEKKKRLGLTQLVIAGGRPETAASASQRVPSTCCYSLCSGIWFPSGCNRVRVYFKVK